MGRKRIFTPEQNAERRRERGRAGYWTRRGLPVPPRVSKDERQAQRRERHRAGYWLSQGLPVPEKGPMLGRENRVAQARGQARQFVQEYKRANPCVDCGYADVRALHFDHRDRTTKKYEVGRMAREGRSIELIQEEIAKCDVRCANCHAIRSQTEEHWRVVEEWERV